MMRLLPYILTGFLSATTFAAPKTSLESLVEYPDLPALAVPDDFAYTDNKSDILVINVWDYNHWDRDAHERIMSTVDEIVREWDVSLVGREDFYGSESHNYVSYPLPGNSIGVDPLIDSLGRIVDINDALAIIDKKMTRRERKRLIRQYAYEVSQYPVSKVFSPRQLLKEPTPLFYDLTVHYRSYSAVDELVSKMRKDDQSRAVMVYGLGHYQQINGYLDHLGISHMDIIIDRQQFDNSMSWQLNDKNLAFSENKLQEYKTKIKPQIDRKKARR